jgi:hypothetical protein
MRDVDPTAILERLLAVTLWSRDAFAHAACAVSSVGLSRLFVHRAEDQVRIATYLSEQLALGMQPPVATSAMPNGGSSGASDGASSPGVHDPYTLLSECMRVLDASLLEFRLARGVALSLAQRVRLDRHQDQMRWSREELLHLRGECKTPRVLAKGEPNVAHRPHVLEAPGLGVPRYATS